MNLLTQLMLEKAKNKIDEETLKLNAYDFCGSLCIKFNFLNGKFRTIQTNIEEHEQIKDN